MYVSATFECNFVLFNYAVPLVIFAVVFIAPITSNRLVAKCHRAFRAMQSIYICIDIMNTFVSAGSCWWPNDFSELDQLRALKGAIKLGHCTCSPIC